MINFENYVGKNIILITSETEKIDDLRGIRIPGKTYIVKYNNQFYLTRKLSKQDLLDRVGQTDDEFVQYLHNVWKSEDQIDHFLVNHQIMETYQNGKLMKKENTE